MNRSTPRLILPLLAMLCAGLVMPAQAQPTNGKSNGSVAAPVGATQTATEATPAQLPEAAINASPADAVTPENGGKAKPPAAPTLSDLGRSLRNYFTEEELSLLFQYMKESVMASFKDEEVNLPPDLAFKLEILLVRMKRESDHYMDNLIMQLEKDLKNSLKEKLKDKLTPPPIKEQPYNPWLTFPWK